MSDSVRPHRWQPTRPHCPWDSPGKNTGVGCRFLLPCMKVKSESEVAQSCLTLRNPMDCSLPGSSVQGIFQARVLEWGAIAFTQHIRCRLSNREPVGICSMTPGTQTRLCNNLEGREWVGGGREVQERGDRCMPMADSG